MEETCWYDGKPYSSGAEIVVDGDKLICQRDGSWSKAQNLPIERISRVIISRSFQYSESRKDLKIKS